MIPARILGTGCALPPRVVDTASIALEVLAPGPAAQAVAATGIRHRRWAEPGALAAPLAAEALRGALAAARLPPSALRRVIVATSTGGDWLMPATAVDVVAALGIDSGCDGFDVSNACVSFVTAFDLAARIVATGGGPVGVVAVELFSRYLRPEAPRPYLVMGDAAAACIVGEGGAGEGLLASWFEARPDLRGRMGTPQPGRVGVVEPLRFGATSAELTDVAFRALRDGSQAVLRSSGLTLDEVDWFLPHQPNGAMLRQLASSLGFPFEKMCPVVEELGSLGAAVIPMSLHELLRTRPVRPGDRILMASVGSGTACGAALFQMGSRT